MYETARRIRDYCKGDYVNIREALSKIDWDQLLIGSMDDSWNTFKQLLLDLESEFIPLKEVRSNFKNRKPIWMTHKALRCVRHKGKVFRKYKDDEHPAVKNAAKVARRELRKAKYKFEKSLAKNIKQDTKSFYAYTRSKSKTKP